MDEKKQASIQEEFSRQAQHMAAAPAFQAQDVLQRLARAVGEAPQQRVLDVACGPGIVAEALAPRVREVVGIDATPKMIELARQRFDKAGLCNGRFEVAAAERLPFAGGEFDAVVTRLSLHHFGDVRAVLHEIRRVTRGGGRLAVADVISSMDPELSALHNALERLRDPTHVRMLSEHELLEALADAGYRLVGKESWAQPRAFAEWTAIISDPARTAPLETVMRALAQAGLQAGIGLGEAGSELRFTHTWLLVTAEAG